MHTRRTARLARTTRKTGTCPLLVVINALVVIDGCFPDYRAIRKLPIQAMLRAGYKNRPANRLKGEINRTARDAANQNGAVIDFLFRANFPCYLSCYFPANSLFRFQAGSHLLQSLPADRCHRTARRSKVPCIFPC
jgi:hypothetical protein